MTGVSGSNDIPAKVFIYHITHVENLPRIIECGGLHSHAGGLEIGLDNKNVGMNTIKERRLSRAVKCHPGTHVGDYVPFYFCPRSVMLYLLYMMNHPDLTYRGGQGEIIHLVASLDAVVAHAQANDIEWAFTATNARAEYTQFYRDLSDLNEISWQAVKATDFRDRDIKALKQAEFLFHGFFPWSLVAGIGVKGQAVYDKVMPVLEATEHKPELKVKNNWYF